MVNLRDPVTMHLLMETAMSDSMQYDVVSFEEIEELKKEHALVKNRIEACKRKFALESKLRDAAQSLSRLYSTKDGKDASNSFNPDGSLKSPKPRRSFGLGSTRQTSLSQSQDELAASTRKAEDLAQEIWDLEKREQDLSTKILRHTAGILQLTHKGLKKNVRKEELPRSPESMSEYNHRSVTTIDSIDGFDERSLYRDMEQYDEYGNIKPKGPSPEALQLQETEKNLGSLTAQLQTLMERSNHGHSPVVPPPDPTQAGLQNLLSFFPIAFDQLGRRIDHFVEHKAILNTQIQQQRELNTKSDAERDSQITGLTSQLAEQKSFVSTTEQESQTLRNQIQLLSDQLDSARQATTLLEQQSTMNSTRALEAEKSSRRDAEAGLYAELQTAQNNATSLQSTITSLQNEASIASQRHEASLRDTAQAKEAFELDLQRSRAEISELEESVVRAQTELTVVRAELDGAYGTRAQRAAEVASNPAIQAELDRLNETNSKLVGEVEYLKTHYEPINRTPGANTESKEEVQALQMRVATLENELRETIEDYELMTKASIEFERERDGLETVIDGLREKLEVLEGRVSDEKVRWLGMKSPNQLTKEGAANGGFGQELTSTMVLKNEFKKMMRDTRGEHARILRAEQEERRRLENLLRTIKKEQQQAKKPPQPPAATLTAATPNATDE
ncbi:MAG: hypothetical protein Q9160_004889 [Pyrenula sp. 1 TL-2023]